MSEENRWKEVSKDISDISNKIKDNLVDDENINDLKETLNSAKNSIKTNFSDLLSAIEATVQDEQIKNESLEVIKKMKNEFYNTIESIRKRIHDTKNIDTSAEEEDFKLIQKIVYYSMSNWSVAQSVEQEPFKPWLWVRFLIDPLI